MRPDTYETVCACVGGLCIVAMIGLAALWAGWLS
jgi:hypothetical protein